MKRFFVLFSIIIMFITVPLCCHAAVVAPDVTILKEDGYDFLFPDIVKKSDDSLLVVSYKSKTGASHAPYQVGDPLGVIVQVDGSADGRNWNNSKVLVSAAELAEWGLGVWYNRSEDSFYYNEQDALNNNAEFCVEARDPNLARLNDGTLLFTFFTRVPGASTLAGHQYWNEGKHWYTWGRTYIMYSKDDGVSWSVPVEILCDHLDRNCAKRGNIAVYSDDSILIPLYGLSSKVSESFSRSEWCTVNVRAKLNIYGEWEFTDEYVTNGNSKTLSVFGYGVTEASFGTTKEDITYAMIRYYKYDIGDPGGDIFVSTDYGATWNKVDITNPHAMQAGFCRMDNNDLFVTWSQTPTPRKIFARIFDTDQSWTSTDVKLIYENPTSYDIGDPSGIQLSNGDLLTIFYDTSAHHIAGIVKEPSFFYASDCKHDYSSAIVTNNVSCTEKGLQYFVCKSCNSVKTEEIMPAHHFEANLCINCNYDRADDCTCKCHSSGIHLIFFKIFNFFQKLFGKNAICVCGVLH